MAELGTVSIQLAKHKYRKASKAEELFWISSKSAAKITWPLQSSLLLTS